VHASVLLLGLDENLAAELHSAVAEQFHKVVCEPFRSPAGAIDAIDRTAADLVFCTAEASAYTELLDALRERGREVPVVVVSRLPEVEKWLDAMDAGACDYCAAPFEQRLIRSIVDSALKYPRELAAVC
jgi:DNA-binding NtrC family response regulator